MKKFNIDTDTIAYSDYDFRGNQKYRADNHLVTRVFDFRDIRGNVNALPQYILDACRAAGMTPHYLGGTTYSHSVIGLAKTTMEDVRRKLERLCWCPENIGYIRHLLNDSYERFPELPQEFKIRFVKISMGAAA